MTAPNGPTRRGRTGRSEHGIPISTGLLVLSTAAAVAGALSGAEPVGVGAIDAVWCAVFSVVVVLAASRARRLPTTVLGGIAGVVGVGGDAAGIAFGVLSLVGTGYVAITRTRERLVGALVGLLAGQALLRGPSYGFVGLPTLVAGAAVVPVLVSAWRLARTRERRLARTVLIALGAVVLVGAATAAVAALESRRQLERGADLAEQGLDHLRTGEIEAAAATFAEAQDEFQQASSTIDGPLGLAGRAVPVVAPNLEALRRVSAAGEELGATASQAASTADWRRLTAAGGVVDLAKVRQMQAPVAESAAALDAALVTVAEVRSPWLLAPLDDQLDRLDEKLVDAADEASIAAEALEVVPALLGGDGPTRWFVAFATPGESRNAGGFVGAFAYLDAVDGRLSVGETGSTMADLDPADGDTFDLELTPEWQALYSGYDVARFPGNMSASPDWPTDGAVAGQIAPQSEGGSPVAGVIYADPAALAALLRLTGPVEVDGVPEPLTAENVERYLLVDQYVRYEGESDERREVLGDVARAVFDALVEQPLPGIQELADVVGPAVSAGHLKVTALDDTAAEAFLDRVGLSGAFGADPEADVLSLRSSNLVASKIDVFLRRDVTATVEVDPRTGAVTTTVDVVLRNEAPADDLPDYLIGDGTEVPRGTNRDLLTLFTSLSLDGVEVDGVPGRAQAHEEQGLRSYGVVVDIPAGGEIHVTYRLSGPPPAGLVDTGVYELVVVPQALSVPDTWTVTVAPGNPAPMSETGPLVDTLKFSVRPAE